MSKSLIEAMKRRADAVENWVSKTTVIPLDEVIWEIRQHQDKQPQNVVERVAHAIKEYADTLPQSSRDAPLFRSHRIGFAKVALAAIPKRQDCHKILQDILSRFKSCIGGGNGEIEGDKEAIAEAEAAIATMGDAFAASGKPISDNEASFRLALEAIREIWSGSECGEPVHAQEAYAIHLCKQMYQEAVDALRGEAPKREYSNRVLTNTALGVILNHRDVLPEHIVEWASQKIDLSGAEDITDEIDNEIEVQEPKP